MAQTREAVREQDLAQARKTIEDLKAQREDIDRQIHEASAIIRGWEAFDLAVQGKLTLPGEAAPAQTAEPKPRKAIGTRAKPGEIPDLWNKIAAVVERYDKGALARAIYDELGARSAAEKRRIDVALPKMKAAEILDQPEGPRKPYFLGSNYQRPGAPAQETPAAETTREEAPALAEQEAE